MPAPLLAIAAMLLVLALGPAQAHAAPPPNDSFANAQVVGPAVPIAVPATTVDATAEVGEPVHAGNPAQRSVWFSWTPAVSVTAVLDVCDTNPPINFTSEVVYTGNAVNALTAVASNAGDCLLRFEASAGQNYKIAVDTSFEGGTFTFRLRQLAPPANDHFATAETLPAALPFTVVRSNLDSTAETNEPAVNGGGDARSVWFNWTPSSTGSVRLDICDFQTRSGASNRAVSIFTGNSLTTLTTVFSSNLRCRTTFDAISGTTYRISFSGTIFGEGTFTLTMLQAVPPANDDFTGAIPVGPGLPVAVTDDNRFATVEMGEPFHGNVVDTTFPPRDSVWYTWTPTANVQARVRVCDDDFSAARLGVYTGTAVNNLTRVTPSVPINSFPFCSIRFNATMGTTYRIAVGGSTEDTEGSFLLDIHAFTPPANDNFANPQQLPSSLPIAVAGSTIDSGAETDEPNHGEDFGALQSVWYRWTPSVSEPVSIDTCASDFDALIGVHMGTALDALTRVETSEGGPGCGGPSGGRLTLNAVAGTTYFIAVDGFDEGHFTLALNSLSPISPAAPVPGFNLKAALKKCKKKFPKGKKRKKCIKKAKKRARSSVLIARAGAVSSG
jgi:hypothetical protein